MAKRHIRVRVRGPVVASVGEVTLNWWWAPGDTMAAVKAAVAKRIGADPANFWLGKRGGGSDARPRLVREHLTVFRVAGEEAEMRLFAGQAGVSYGEKGEVLVEPGSARRSDDPNDRDDGDPATVLRPDGTGH